MLYYVYIFLNQQFMMLHKIFIFLGFVRLLKNDNVTKLLFLTIYHNFFFNSDKNIFKKARQVATNYDGVRIRIQDRTLLKIFVQVFFVFETVVSSSPLSITNNNQVLSIVKSNISYSQLIYHWANFFAEFFARNTANDLGQERS